jgi:hypothetical protein
LYAFGNNNDGKLGILTDAKDILEPTLLEQPPLFFAGKKNLDFKIRFPQFSDYTDIWTLQS